jgi:hypothetical protein
VKLKIKGYENKKCGNVLKWYIIIAKGTWIYNIVQVKYIYKKLLDK